MERLTYKTNGKCMNTVAEQAPPYSIDCDIDTAITKLAEYEDLEEQGKLVKMPCKLRDTVLDLVFCDDGEYRIFEMKVCAVREFGEVRDGKVWNVYLEDKYTKAYRSFYDFGKTVFLTREAAEAALKEMSE